MPIDTKIAGNPDSVRGAAHWMRDSLGKGISEATSQIYNARNRADAGWRGPASEGFRNKITGGARKCDQLAAAATDSAQKFDDYAAELQRAQDDMRRVKDEAVGAGLVVKGDVVQDPPPAPPAPGPAPTGSAATPEAVTVHNNATSAANAHASLVDAYNAAEHAAAAARQIGKLAADTLKNVWSDVSQKWFLVIGDLANGAAGALAVQHVSILTKQSQFLADESAKFLNLAKSAPEGSTVSQIYRDVNAGQAAAHSADDAAKAAADMEKKAPRVGLKVGGALAVAGVVYDIAHGKPVGQAVVSGAAGFGASVAAGAGLGSAVGTIFPGVGNVVGAAVGAVGGAVVGVFTSGVVDSIYQNGIGAVGTAIEEGANAVVDAGKAIGGAVEDVWNAIF